MPNDTISQITCRLTGGISQESLIREFMEYGALDTFVIPGNPSTLCILCKPDKTNFIASKLQESLHVSVQIRRISRYILNREFDSVSTEYGPVKRKTSSGFSVRRSKLEFEDLKEISFRENIPLHELRRKLSK